ncbi:uncharacterized protein LOC128709381 [Anopheles marshallii]|uniref:uncharacterized protein LOC128709381 n=1 Tax=Anopheles marshallii TaxID=1521116 RepID=UPI00237C26C4|nr:uncharacterized protein LOC128709381 [Anopheles marshallii]
MKLSLWWLLIVIGVGLNSVKVRGESHIKRLAVREGRRGFTLLSSRRTITSEPLCCTSSETDFKNTSKCGPRTAEHEERDMMTGTPYLTLALKVLLMVILCYTL